MRKSNKFKNTKAFYDNNWQRQRFILAVQKGRSSCNNLN